jgi:hypothetical protein
MLQKGGNIDEEVSHRIKARWLKWHQVFGVLCDPCSVFRRRPCTPPTSSSPTPPPPGFLLPNVVCSLSPTGSRAAATRSILPKPLPSSPTSFPALFPFARRPGRLWQSKANASQLFCFHPFSLFWLSVLLLLPFLLFSIWFFIALRFPPSLSPLFCPCFFFAHVVSSLANLLETKMLGCWLVIQATEVMIISTEDYIVMG